MSFLELYAFYVCCYVYIVLYLIQPVAAIHVLCCIVRPTCVYNREIQRLLVVVAIFEFVLLLTCCAGARRKAAVCWAGGQSGTGEQIGRPAERAVPCIPREPTSVFRASARRFARAERATGICTRIAGHSADGCQWCGGDADLHSQHHTSRPRSRRQHTPPRWRRCRRNAQRLHTGWRQTRYCVAHRLQQVTKKT